jgi:AcrR family transcriptional regulator
VLVATVTSVCPLSPTTQEDNQITLTKQVVSRSGPEKILAVVVRMLRSGGTDAVQLVDVARRSRVSLTTIYKHFGSRDELILAAVEAWMESHVYRPLAEPAPEEPLFDALTRHFRHIFEPWEQDPRMAEAFMRARFGPGGDRLMIQGSAVEPITRPLFKDVDPARAEDIMTIVANVIFGMVFRFATGEVPVTEIMPTVERTLFRLTSDIESPAPTRRSTRPQAKRSSPLA